MNEQTVEAAEHEAEEFLLRVSKLKVRIASGDVDWRSLEIGVGCKESAAVRRQSMELSNALVAVRKGMNDR